MKTLHAAVPFASLLSLLFAVLTLGRSFAGAAAQDTAHDPAALDSIAVRAAPGLEAPDPYTLVAGEHLVDGPSARTESGVHVVVEIPAGTNGKWEVDKEDGALKWEFKKGAPRVVEYLPYPGNYGMVPRTLLAKEDGGDGDPLDVLVLGPAQPRGAVVEVRLIGVLRMKDGGEQDDKLLAVLEHSPFHAVRDLGDLQESFPGVDRIVETWFTSYKGPGVMESGGFADAAEAERILARAMAAYEGR